MFEVVFFDASHKGFFPRPSLPVFFPCSFSFTPTPTLLMRNPPSLPSITLTAKNKVNR